MTPDDPSAGLSPDPRPRVLLVSDRSPSRTNGNSIRVLNVIDGLSRDFDLHVLLLDVSHDGETLSATGDHATTTIRAERAPRWLGLALSRDGTPTDVHYRARPSLRRRIDEALGDAPWDAIWCSRPRTYLLLDGLFAGVPRIVDFDDLNDLLLLSLARDRLHRRTGLSAGFTNLWDRMDAHRWGRLHRRLMRESASQVVCKESDRDHLGPQAVVVPNSYPDPTGAGGWTAPDAGPAVDPFPGGPAPTMFFAGALTYLPNRFGVEWFARRVLPMINGAIPAAELTVAGMLGDHLADGDLGGACRLLGFVDEVAPFIQASALVVAPIWSGGGTKLKVAEALAWGKPLVATSVAVEGFGLVDGEEVLVADTASDFADACVRVLTDPTMAAQLGRAARRRFETDRLADVSADMAAQVVASIIGASAAVRSPARS